MNDLSWMLYWADVAGNISVTTGVLAVGSAIGGCVATLVKTVATDFDNIGKPQTNKKRPLFEGWNAGRKFFLVALAAAAIGAPIPSKETIYAIAASEMGEQALKTPIATKAGKALEKWLDEQIGDKPNGDGK